MRYPRMRSVLASLALIGASVLTAAPGLAQPGAETAERAAEIVARYAAATSEAEQNRVERYWTPERMRSAIPAATRFRDGADTASRATKSAVTAVRQAANVEPEAPRPRHGKVFFTMNGVDYVCSATATRSHNRDVVTTAGHCVHEGDGGSFATHFAFVPAYYNGLRPFGTWTAEALFTTRAWAQSGDFTYDVGFAVLNENARGQSLTEVVGGYPIAFNLPRGLTYTAYGYPAGAPFDGQRLYSCTDTASPDPRGSGDHAITCGMTGGSSGGGWITNGVLNSVNSFGYTGDPTTMYGPYFGDRIQAVYRRASTA